MAMSLVQTNTVQSSTLSNYCSSSGGTIEAGRQASVGGTTGTTEQTFTVAAGAATDNEFSFECVIPDDSTTGAGTWTVPINFSTGDMDVTLEEVWICQVRSSSNIATVGSNTGLGLSTTAGTQSPTVSGSAMTWVNGDVAIITLVFSEAAGHADGTIGITPDQTITSPFTAPAASGRTMGSIAGEGGLAGPGGLAGSGGGLAG